MPMKRGEDACGGLARVIPGGAVGRRGGGTLVVEGFNWLLEEDERAGVELPV